MEDKKLTTQDLINMIPLTTETNELANEIINEKDLDKLKNLTHLFNLNQAKKNVLRVLKLNSLLDHVSDEMITRFQKVPGEFSNSDLLNYMNVVQASIDRANKSLNLVDETPAIQFNQLNVNINEESELNRESREKVADAVKAIMAKLGKLPEEKSEESVSIIKENEIVIEDTNSTVINNISLLNGEGE